MPYRSQIPRLFANLANKAESESEIDALTKRVN